MTIPKPATYDQGFAQLQQAIIHAELSMKVEEMKLNEMKLFSKNDVEKMKERWFMTGLLCVIGTAVAVVIVMRILYPC